MGSTIASVFVNVTLVADYVNTKQFRDAGSGLTRKQHPVRGCVVLLHMHVVYHWAWRYPSNYYTTTAPRIVLFFLTPVGIVPVALVIATTRETVLGQTDSSNRATSNVGLR
ncbi:hypothetical protein A4X06_0g6597 [Tilletia controversa]|uniref:Uncharacterized protein n=2 Tax=Tilletia TaxID=13289 RepID=A0A8X7SUN2_9BASI|nr:hypothetical protein CF336_g6077 [Tilletia laevis]KAE8193824.1 hypothetical protein CF335_g5491 [Tilletia laevis]KAE8243034.1 hypothetical protein A4X06_0g6597 [Tilletia controversa]KAE8255526.1 hypothetical protein A4X03_0g5552 [Tilletia caries]